MFLFLVFVVCVEGLYVVDVLGLSGGVVGGWVGVVVIDCFLCVVELLDVVGKNLCVYFLVCVGVEKLFFGDVVFC